MQSAWRKSDWQIVASTCSPCLWPEHCPPRYKQLYRQSAPIRSPRDRMPDHACSLRRRGPRATIAKTVDAYVAIAVGLGRDPTWRADVSRKISALKPAFYRDNYESAPGAPGPITHTTSGAGNWTDLRLGWTAGACFEALLTKNWRVRARGSCSIRSISERS